MFNSFSNIILKLVTIISNIMHPMTLTDDELSN